MNDQVLFWQAAILFIGSYLLGSTPTAYLVCRWIKGVDIRQYGSGNVGGNNVGNIVGRWATFPVGIFDLLKAAFPTWLALHILEWGYPLAVAAGLCALIGHNWSIYLSFYGGRGLGTILGTLLVVFPVGTLVLLLPMGIGYLLHTTAGSTIGLLLLPIASLVLDTPAAVTWGCVAMILITAAKRLEANRRPLPAGPERWLVIWRRLWLDRDIADHKKWLAQRPDNNGMEA